jgi:3-oxoacyl-[acyl-carrier-protein] synthase II
MNKRRVVVTGLGVVSSVGMNVEEFWNNIKANKTGIKRLSFLDENERYNCWNGGYVEKDVLKEAASKYKIRNPEKMVEMAILACQEAMEDSGLIEDFANPVLQKCAVILGTGVGCIGAIDNMMKVIYESGKGIRAARPSSIPVSMANSVSSSISVKYQLTGPNYVLTSACSSATAAIGNSWRMIADGYIDKVLTGGGDAVFSYGHYAAWTSLRVLSSIEDPDTCCRPFDESRKGCILGEGAAMLVLESLDSALERGATIYGEIVGYGESSDASHITRPNPDGQVDAMKMAMDSAGITPADVGYINAHGTATIANDPTESGSIVKALGEETDNVPVSSFKAYYGHLLGASGAIETLQLILGLKEGCVQGNRNLVNVDEGCSKLNLPVESFNPTKDYVLKNSFAFGGNNSVLVLKKFVV